MTPVEFDNPSLEYRYGMDMLCEKALLNSFQVLKMAGVWLLLGVTISCKQGSTPTTDTIRSRSGSDIVTATPSKQCYECHQSVYESWAASDHANANRLFRASDWKEAFHPVKYFTLNGEISRFFEDSGQAIIETVGPDGAIQGFKPEMVLAHRPMVQFLIPFNGGRWQTTELAWDVNNKQWFDVYGDEYRRANEWGHWSQRGMNWNAQCAVCHTSFYSKNYDPDTDAYTSTWKEMGINCQQCHGEMTTHIADPEAPIVGHEQVSADSYYESCFSCHSRREDLTGNFRIGDKFSDHHRLQLPTNERYYFADGQNKDEVFVYGSFLMSKMYRKDVRCLDCHDPHSLTLKLPFETNELCMRCHQSPGLNEATVIDPVAHGHHVEGSIGNRCVECHMPERVYMERDPRRDHGFHTPDPMLAKELDLPNACMNCHDQEGEGTEWVEKAFNEWYGETENLQGKRFHARTVAKAYQRDPSTKADLLKLLKTEESPMWRGAFAQMILEMQPTQEEVQAILPLLEDDSPLVRSAMVQSLSNFPDVRPLMIDLLKDESRLVRLDASWYLRAELDAGSELDGALQHYMKYASDQPGGALRQAHYAAEKGDKETALKWMDRVVEWDQTSADAWINRGMMLHRFDEADAAIESFEMAHQLEPQSTIPLSYQAMLIGEGKDLAKTRAAWERVLKLDRTNGRAWYNLGLLMAQDGNMDAAIGYLDQGSAVSPEDADIPYAKATLLLRTGKIEEAMQTLRFILKTNPDYAPALQMLQMIKTHPQSNGE